MTQIPHRQIQLLNPVYTHFGSLQLSIMWGKESLRASTECRSHQHFTPSESGRRPNASCNNWINLVASCTQFNIKLWIANLWKFTENKQLAATTLAIHLKFPGLVHRGGHKREMARFPGFGGCTTIVSAFLLSFLSLASCTVHLFIALLWGF